MKSTLVVMLLFASTTIAQSTSISGVVKLADGSPAAGMHVAVTRLPIDSSADTSAETDSDKDGHFLFAALAPGMYTIGASSATIAAGWTTVDVAAEGSASRDTTSGPSRSCSATQT